MQKEVEMAEERTLGALRDEIIKRLDKSYQLVYVDYRDELTDEQVAMIARGDYESLWESSIDWESGSRSDGARYHINELVDDVIRDWEREDDADYSELKDGFDLSAEWDEVNEAIQDRDDSDPYREMAAHTSDVLMRVNVDYQMVDPEASPHPEDNAYPMGEEDPSPERLLTDVGLPVTERNVKVANSILANSNPYYSGATCSWIFAADVEWLYMLSSDPEAIIEITNPYLWLGNPWQGDGWVNEEPFEGTVRVKRGNLRTDKDNWGYGWNAVVGGVYVSGYEVELKVVEKEESK
jgi:hypothetical protein